MQLPYDYLEGEMLEVTKNRPHVHLLSNCVVMTDRIIRTEGKNGELKWH